MSITTTFTVGQVVRLASPEPGEEDARYAVVEDNGNRVLIRLVCDLPIAPVETVRPSDITEA